MSLPPSSPRRFAALDGARGMAVLSSWRTRGRFRSATAGYRAGPRSRWVVRRTALLCAERIFAHVSLLHPTASEPAQPATWLNYVLRRFLRIFPHYTSLFDIGVDRARLRACRRDEPSAAARRPSTLLDHRRGGRSILHSFRQSYCWARWFSLRRWIAAVAALSIGGVLVFFAGGFFETVWSMTRDVWLSEYLGVFLAGSAVGVLYATIVRQGWTFQKYRTWFDVVGVLCLLLAIRSNPGCLYRYLPAI